MDATAEEGVAAGDAITVGALTFTLDRASAVPLYDQVARQLEQGIGSGALPHGSRLENELDLADQLGLSRPTVRRAIQELVAKGLLVRKRGVGTQVVQGQVDRSLRLTSLYDDLAGSAQHPRTEVLGYEHAPAGSELGAVLGVPDDAVVLHVTRLRSAQGEPLAVMENWLPPRLAGLTREQLESRGLYELLRARGVSMRVGQQRIGARRGSPGECRLLDEKAGAALLTMERTTYDDVGRAVEFGRHAYRGSRYHFTATLVDH